MEDLRPKGAIGTYVFNEEGQILLLLRTSKHGEGTWCPPGGHIEYGESFEQAAIREAKEECGIDVQKIEVMGVTSDVYANENKHYITVHTIAVVYTGKPKLMEPNKFKDISWFNLDDMPANLFPANRHFFELNLNCPCGSGIKLKECAMKNTAEHRLNIGKR